MNPRSWPAPLALLMALPLAGGGIIRVDGDLVSKPAAHLFGTNTTRVAFRRGAYLRSYVLTFAELLSDRLSRHLIERAMNSSGDSYEL